MRDLAGRVDYVQDRVPVWPALNGDGQHVVPGKIWKCEKKVE